MHSDDVLAMAAAVLAGIAPEADLAALADDDDMREVLDLDSMDFLNFVTGLQQRIGVEIPDADAPRLATLRGLRAYFGR
jgi:acyl carrier protein